MAVYNEAGTEVSEAQFGTNLGSGEQTTIFTVDQKYYEDFTFPGSKTKGRRVKFYAGQKITEAEKADAYRNPEVTSASPLTGPAAGGTEVTIHGRFLTGATAVKFGTTDGTDFEVVSDSMVKVTSPAGTAGNVALSLVHPNGNVSYPGGWTYTA